MFVSVITKNSKWEILTKNLVTFKDKMGFTKKFTVPQNTLCQMKIFNYLIGAT